MNQELAKRFWPVMKAFSEGAIVQHRLINRAGSDWKDCEYPVFNDPHDEYRIKPEPRFREWGPREVPMPCLIRKRGTNDYPSLIMDVSHGYITHFWDGLGNQRTYPELFLCWDHSLDGGKTWKPCGVEL